MNCNDCQRVILENGGRDHDAALLAHLAACPACAKVNERTLAISKLLGLKRHEQPHPHFDIRNAAAIRKRISEEKPSVFSWNPVSLFRPWHGFLAGAACIAVALVGLHFNGPGKQNPAAGIAKQPTIEAPQPATPPLIDNTKPLLVVEELPPGKGTLATHTKFGAETNQIKPADFTVPPQP